MQFAYMYKRPPIYDNKLNDLCLRVLSYAPVPMFAVAYWQYGNRQIFFNQVLPLNFMTDVQKSYHVPFDYSEGVDHTILMFINVFVFIFFRTIFKSIRKCYRKCYHKKDSKMERKDVDELHADEDINDYWQCIPGQDQKRWFTKETHMRKTLNIRHLDDVNYPKL